MKDENFEAVVKAIKESKEPVAELAKVIKQQLTPVKAKQFYNVNVTKLSLGDRAFEVALVRKDNDIFNYNLMYKINNEINESADCVCLNKGMLYKTSENVMYALTKAFIAEDKLVLNFVLVADDTDLLK